MIIGIGLTFYNVRIFNGMSRKCSNFYIMLLLAWSTGKRNIKLLPPRWLMWTGRKHSFFFLCSIKGKRNSISDVTTYPIKTDPSTMTTIYLFSINKYFHTFADVMIIMIAERVINWHMIRYFFLPQYMKSSTIGNPCPIWLRGRFWGFRVFWRKKFNNKPLSFLTICNLKKTHQLLFICKVLRKSTMGHLNIQLNLL